MMSFLEAAQCRARDAGLVPNAGRSSPVSAYQPAPDDIAEMLAAREAVLKADQTRRIVQPPVGSAAAIALQAQHQNLADEVKDIARRKYLGIKDNEPLPSHWPVFVAVEALTQVVAGTNYFVKVRVNEDDTQPDFVWLRIYENLFGGKPELHGMKADDDKLRGPVKYF